MNIIQILMALVALYQQGKSALPALQQDVLTPKNLADFYTNFPNSKVAIDQAIKGKAVDWTVLLSDLEDFTTNYLARPDAKESFLKALRVFRSWMRTGSESAEKAIRKYSAHVASPVLRSVFSADAVDQKVVNKKLTQLVKQLGGQAGANALTLEESKAAKEADPELYKQYLALRRDFSQAWKDELSNYVRSSGKTIVPIKDALAHLASLGITHSMPLGFTGGINALGEWFTKEGEKVPGVPSSTMFPTVKMNRKRSPDNAWVFQAVRPDGQLANQFYTEDHVKKKAQEKFAKVKDFDAAKVRKKWQPLIMGFDPADARSVAAVILDILFQSSNRIGKVGLNPAGGGFGIATLLVAHVRPQTDGSFKFIYLGKDSVKTVTLIKKSESRTNAKICEILAYLISEKSPKEPVFTYNLKNGTYKPVQLGVVRALFSSVSGGLNVHTLRTAKGSELFRGYLDTLFAKKTALDMKGAMEALKKGGLVVGKALNHVRHSAEGEAVATHATALKNYIDPMMQAELFAHYGLPMPAYLERLIVSDDSDASRVTSASEGEEATEEQEVKDGQDPEAPKPADSDGEAEPEEELTPQEKEALEQILSDDVLMDTYEDGYRTVSTTTTIAANMQAWPF